MSSVLALLAIPAIMVMGIYRLWCIPCRVKRGELRFDRERGRLHPALAALGYSCLLGYTVGTLAGLALYVSRPEAWSLVQSGWLMFLAGAYPLVYLATEGAMHVGLREARG